jgi:hypothetical protein
MPIHLSNAALMRKKPRPVCFLCSKGFTTEPYVYRGLSGRDYLICGYCHTSVCTGCAQCERSD